MLSKPIPLPETISISPSLSVSAMIDELVTNDRHEPLRVTTSSSEFRLVLRSDNAEERLTPIGYKLGLVSRERYQSVIKATEEVTKEIDNLSAHIIKPNKQNLAILQKLGSSHINKPISMAQLLARSEIEYAHTANFGYSSEFDTKHHLALEIRLKYSIFIDKLQRRIHHVNELDSMILTDNCHFSNVTGLSSDVKDQLINLSPYSIGQISRIRGFKTSDLAILIHHYKQGVL